jgi:hypothetical protein
MAYSPIAFTAANYRDYKNYWLKAYEPGTTTPVVMATDSTLSTFISKSEVNVDGFLISAGNALIIPHVNGTYDLWLFPTEVEAEANDTSNALRLADSITGAADLAEAVTLAPVSETVTLIDGQTVVTFPTQTTGGAEFHINGIGVDSRMLTSLDYNEGLTTASTITLFDSYPAGSLVTLSKNTSSGASSVARDFVHNEATLGAATLATNLVAGDSINLAERTTGNGGGAMWDVVLSTSVTENGYNIVQCTGVPTLSLVLRIEGAVNVRQFGAKGDGVVDDTPAIQAAINYLSDGVVFAPVGNYSITGLITKRNISIKGEGLNATYFYVTGSGAVGIRCAAHDSLLGADDAAWGTFEDFGIRFSNDSQVGISFVGLSRWYTKNVLTIMAGFGATGIQCKSTVTRASGGPSQWYNRFENVNHVGTAPSQAAGAIGWDIGGTLATDEQATAWYVTGGRTNFCQIGVWLKGVSHVDFTNHVTETNDDNYIIGTSGVGERHANDVNIVAAYIEGGGNGVSLLENSFRCSIIKPDMTSGTGTAFSDLGDENKLQDFASINKMTALTYEITKLNPLQNPVIIGSSAGYDFNDSLSDTVTTIRNGRSIANSTSRYQIVHEGVVELRGGTVSHGIYPTKTIYGESLGAGAVGAYVGSLNPPTNGIGKDGDTYTSTGGGGTFYQKRSGAWVSI